MRGPTVTRRHVLTGMAGLTAAGLLGKSLLPPAQARAPLTNTPAPGFYRFRIGALEATVASDGPLGPMGDPATLFPGAPKEEIATTLTDNFLPADNLQLDQNALVINTGDRLVLFDTGLGASRMFGSMTGRLLTSLQSAGIAPRDMDAVVLTHAHPDHCWGLAGDDGKPHFPNAQIYMAQADYDFWTDEGKLGQDALKSMIEGTRKSLVPSRERIVFVKDGQEFLPGIQALAAPGHTVGHTAYLLTSQGQTLCFTGDIAHHHILSVETPRHKLAFDTDGDVAVRSRLRVLDMLAAQRLQLLSYHFPWPGIGHVAKQGEGFRYVPSPMRTVL